MEQQQTTEDLSEWLAEEIPTLAPITPPPPPPPPPAMAEPSTVSVTKGEWRAVPQATTPTRFPMNLNVLPLFDVFHEANPKFVHIDKDTNYKLFAYYRMLCAWYLILYSVNWTQIDTLVDGAVLWIKTHDYFSSAAIYDCTIRLSNCQMRQRSTENTHLRQHQGLSYLKSLRRIGVQYSKTKSLIRVTVPYAFMAHPSTLTEAIPDLTAYYAYLTELHEGVVLGACSILFSLHRDMLNCDLNASPLPKPRPPTEQELQTLLDDRLYRTDFVASLDALRANDVSQAIVRVFRKYHGDAVDPTNQFVMELYETIVNL